jgi:hypothetical protein
MKKLTLIALSAIVLTLLSTAQAQAQSHGPRHNQGQAHRHPDRQPQRHGDHHRLWAPAIIGAAIAGVVGGVIYRAQSPVYIPSGVVFQPAVQPPQTSYYCSPYQAYYPSVTACPVPWQIIQYP